MRSPKHNRADGVIPKPRIIHKHTSNGICPNSELHTTAIREKAPHEAEAGAIHPIKLNEVDPQAWLADVLDRLPDHPASRIAELLPWNWKAARLAIAA